MTRLGENRSDQWVKCSQTTSPQHPITMVLVKTNLKCPVTCIHGDRCNFISMILIFILVIVKVKYLVSSAEFKAREPVGVVTKPEVIRRWSWDTRMTAPSKRQGPMKTHRRKKPQGHSPKPQGRCFTQGYIKTWHSVLLGFLCILFYFLCSKNSST